MLKYFLGVLTLVFLTACGEVVIDENLSGSLIGRPQPGSSAADLGLQQNPNTPVRIEFVMADGRPAPYHGAGRSGLCQVHEVYAVGGIGTVFAYISWDENPAARYRFAIMRDRYGDPYARVQFPRSCHFYRSGTYFDYGRGYFEDLRLEYSLRRRW